MTESQDAQVSESQIAVQVPLGAPVTEAGSDVPGDDHALPLRVLGGGRVVGIGPAVPIVGRCTVSGGPDPGAAAGARRRRACRSAPGGPAVGPAPVG